MQRLTSHSRSDQRRSTDLPPHNLNQHPRGSTCHTSPYLSSVPSSSLMDNRQHQHLHLDLKQGHRDGYDDLPSILTDYEEYPMDKPFVTPPDSTTQSQSKHQVAEASSSSQSSYQPLETLESRLYSQEKKERQPLGKVTVDDYMDDQSGIGSGPGSSRKKIRLEVEEGAKVKKIRQTQSCDACRARKVKCDRPAPGTDQGLSRPARDVCSHCQALQMPCTFDYKPKKRGPPNMYLKKLQEMKQEQDIVALSSSHPAFAEARLEQLQNRANNHLSGTNNNEHPTSSNSLFPHRKGDWIATRTSTSADGTSYPHLENSNHTHPRVDIETANHFRTDEILTPTSGSTDDGLSRLNQLLGSSTFTPYAHIVSAPGINPLDRILPRHQLMYIVDLYFDYIYPLVPAIHKPSFMRDLAERREERQGEEEWFAYVLSVVAATLVQVPRGFIPLPRSEIRELLAKCLSLVKEYIMKDTQDLTIYRVIIIYMHVCAHFTRGDRPNLSPSLLGSSYSLSYKLGLHEESTYEHMPPIERELARRIFWLQFGANVSGKIIDSSVFAWHYDDCSEVSLPRIIDDEYITETEYLEQPEDQTPILAGFWYTSRLYQLLSQIIEKRRQDRKKRPTGEQLQIRIEEVERLSAQILTLMDDCPEQLKIDMTGTPATRGTSIQIEWNATMSSDIKQLLTAPHITKARDGNYKDAFLVQQANIYVTQQMSRYVLIQYREELLAAQDMDLDQDTVLNSTLKNKQIEFQREVQAGVEGNIVSTSNAFLPGRPSLRSDRTRISETEKDQVASDLLVILSKIPMEVLAVNTASLVYKIRLVAGTLLDVLQQTPATTQLSASDGARLAERMNRAQNYLWDFLRIMSEIESAFSMEDDLQEVERAT